MNRNVNVRVTASCGCGIQFKGTDERSSQSAIQQAIEHADKSGHTLDVHGMIQTVKEVPAWQRTTSGRG